MAELGRDAGERLRAVQAPAQRRCAQCWQRRPLASFVGARGNLVRNCAACRDVYSGWEKLSLVEKVARRPARVSPPATGRVIWSEASGNRKLGGIPASISERSTCPPSCGLYVAGCFAEYGMLGAHWRRAGSDGLPWGVFLERVRALPEGQLWRHNVAGDLPGQGEDLDEGMLGQLVDANAGRRGFTFTHKHRSETALEAIRWANLQGFTINLSADTLEDADDLFQVGDGEDLTIAGPVVVLLPHDAPDVGTRTPEGRRVVVCPNETRGVSCADCRLCADPYRTTVIGFRAHGQFKKHLPELVQLRRKQREETRP